MVLLVVILSSLLLVAQAPDLVVGTWELNVAKSQFSPGPPPKREQRIYVVTGQDVRATATGIDRNGKPFTTMWTVNYDGKPRPLSGNADADMLVMTRTDPLTVTFTQSRRGTQVMTGTRIISRDGRIMTITTTGTDAQGRALNNVEVFEKRSR
jgi:type IV secretory pathway protease TraF